MKKTTTAIAFALLMCGVSFAQEQSSQQPSIELLSSNQLTNEVTAHTCRYAGWTASTSADDSGSPAASEPATIQTIINYFMAIPEVSECTFDRATGLFTIVSSTGFELVSHVNSLNAQ